MFLFLAGRILKCVFETVQKLQLGYHPRIPKPHIAVQLNDNSDTFASRRSENAEREKLHREERGREKRPRPKGTHALKRFRDSLSCFFVEELLAVSSRWYCYLLFHGFYFCGCCCCLFLPFADNRRPKTKTPLLL